MGVVKNLGPEETLFISEEVDVFPPFFQISGATESAHPLFWSLFKIIKIRTITIVLPSSNLAKIRLS